MAIATKTVRTLQAATSNAAGATTTSTNWNLSTALGGVLQVRISNGASAPTLGCDCLIQISTDGTSWRDFSRQSAGTSPNVNYDFFAELAPPVLQARVVFSGNSAQAVQVEAFGHELTSIG